MKVSEFNVTNMVDDIQKQNGKIEDVYFVACGGSLIDLYSSEYFVKRESKSMHSAWIPSKEFVLTPPAHLGKNSLVFVCSHGGNTKETVEAADVAYETGAYVITYTHNPQSKCANSKYHSIVYAWESDTPQEEKPMCLTYAILNELIHRQEPEYLLYDSMKDGIEKIDKIIRKAVNDTTNKAWVFSEKYYNEPFLYIMSSGAAYAQSYGFAICSLQEMQWMDCCYINSAEYFHGPFEVTDENHLYILMMSKGKTREIDERALRFLQKYGKKYEVIDAENCGLETIEENCVDYFNAPLFYEMSVLYRTAIENKTRHPLSMRRYMGVVEY
ncbi:SIS domain-containing protein [Clostridium oryzae]|uniref:Fructosamine deglycase FrlB n=1 Tax=Clostridium oryzae TaxID=1450648 RepID=A0A1V4IDI1_9CLOT|nr:SIS domain-containing protein [Clostridium oryzae]OPJ58021.1 fructosamine deglycase FrlB [Clostridium oryzae]